ncbi:MAG: ATP-binding cassette domain-containing protein [Clostridia bacterium]|jgi:oligopeptide transport system ATP-binding protein|nr:ATP-binding cassette domain-containing protein [Clostridia bacterium]MCI2000106.1 ATP-binding cassette domain-containing protein [Clostridia bacterium]MCI2014729.1 ATP-binding cassette domain-containing protein [Clostridia bacterium]
MNDILSVHNLVQHFKINSGLTINAVNGISFDVKKGEIFGLVGESGCGKSTVAKSIMGLYSLTSGEIYFKGNMISDRKIYRKNKDDIHKNMQIIFQDSSSALNPRMTIEKIIREPLKANNMYDKTKSEKQIDELLRQVGLDVSFRQKYPGEISGGQRQRVAIARSIALSPELIIADEPIASLDISIQAQIINLFQKLQREYGFSFIFIAHDLSIVRFLCNRVAVMVKGRIVETAPTEVLFENPLHPYTKSLLSAIPVPDPKIRNSKFIDYNEKELNDNGILKEVCPQHFVYM